MTARMFVLKSVKGVALNQLKDGSIRCHLNPQNAEAFRDHLKALAQQIHDYIVSTVETARAEELSKYQVPPSRIQELEAELERLKNPNAISGYTNGHDIDLETGKVVAQGTITEGFE